MFGIIGRTGPEMRQVVGFGDRSTRRGTFGGDEAGYCFSRVCVSVGVDVCQFVQKN